MSGLRESVINYLMFIFIAVFNFLLPVKAALHYGGFIFSCFKSDLFFKISNLQPTISFEVLSFCVAPISLK